MSYNFGIKKVKCVIHFPLFYIFLLYYSNIFPMANSASTYNFGKSSRIFSNSTDKMLYITHIFQIFHRNYRISVHQHQRFIGYYKRENLSKEGAQFNLIIFTIFIPLCRFSSLSLLKYWWLLWWFEYKILHYITFVIK